MPSARPQPDPVPHAPVAGPGPGPLPDLALLVSRAERRLVERLTALLAEEGCSVEQWRVLSAVADGAGHPMTEIAEYALMPAPSLTKLVDRMVADTLVYRRPDPRDRRRVLLHLAARGRILHQRAAHRVARDQSEILAALGGPPSTEPGEPGDGLLPALARLAQVSAINTSAAGGLGPTTASSSPSPRTAWITGSP